MVIQDPRTNGGYKYEAQQSDSELERRFPSVYSNLTQHSAFGPQHSALTTCPTLTEPRILVFSISQELAAADPPLHFLPSQQVKQH